MGHDTFVEKKQAITISFGYEIAKLSTATK